jgi:hypothetical protein|tara:strand:+ start:15044 stop:15253 length:210 start_codon:yes stop_codon:yes gene_type:complete
MKKEKKYIAQTKLILNRGHLKVFPGQEVVLGPEDEADGIHIDLLLKNGGIIPAPPESKKSEVKDGKSKQ